MICSDDAMGCMKREPEFGFVICSVIVQRILPSLFSFCA